jgi:hypothetical protein
MAFNTESGKSYPFLHFLLLSNSICFEEFRFALYRMCSVRYNTSATTSGLKLLFALCNFILIHHTKIIDVQCVIYIMCFPPSQYKKLRLSKYPSAES